jgi:hypothetical protein
MCLSCHVLKTDNSYFALDRIPPQFHSYLVRYRYISPKNVKPFSVAVNSPLPGRPQVLILIRRQATVQEVFVVFPKFFPANTEMVYLKYENYFLPRPFPFNHLRLSFSAVRSRNHVWYRLTQISNINVGCRLQNRAKLQIRPCCLFEFVTNMHVPAY